MAEEGGGGGGVGNLNVAWLKVTSLSSRRQLLHLKLRRCFRKKFHFCDQMVKKKRVKMSTGQCVESHGHLTKKMGGAFWVGHQSSKLQGFAPGGW